jgi:hypothetical protein
VVSTVCRHVGFPDHFDEETVRNWLSTGLVHGWTDTLDRLGPYVLSTGADHHDREPSFAACRRPLTPRA